MKTKRVLITGGSGFLGQPLVRAFVRAGYTVRAAGRHAMSFPDPVEVVIVPDFESSIDWNPILRGVDIVVHLAGIAHADSRKTSSVTFDQVNRIATIELARAAKGAGVGRFLFISSVRAQTGPSSEEAVREKDEPKPTDNYGRSKLAAELAIASMGLPFTILRPVVIFGPQAKGNVRTLFQLASSPFPLPFKGFKTRRSLLSLDNFVAAVFFMLDNQHTVGETFLIADPAPLTLAEIFTALRKARGGSPGLIYVPPNAIRLALTLLGQGKLWERIGHDLVVDTTKLESFGWHPAIETYEGLRLALAAETPKANDHRPPH